MQPCDCVSRPKTGISEEKQAFEAKHIISKKTVNSNFFFFLYIKTAYENNKK